MTVLSMFGLMADVVSSSKFYFDRNTRDVADGTSEHQWQCLAHLGAGLGVSPRIFHIQGLHDRAAHFIGLSGVRCAIGGRGLNMHPPARDPRESSSLERAACGPSWPPRVHVAATSSPLSEQRLDASEGVGATDAWRQICGPPRALRRRLRHFRWLEQVETEGGMFSARECAAPAKAWDRCGSFQRWSALRQCVCGTSADAAQRWECFEVDLAEFKRKALRELSGVLDFHIRGVDEPVLAGRVCSFWKQLVEDNLAIAARIRYPRKWPPALRKWSRAFRALVVRTANW